MAKLQTTRKVEARSAEGPPTRLVKTWLPVDLVRRVDEVILSSNGAYADRTELFIEALSDRVAEEEAHGRIAPPERPASIAEQEATGSGAVSGEPADTRFGDRLDPESTISTLPRAGGPGFNFGLHNRDLPSLWAFDQLCRLVAEGGSPIAWSDYEAALLPRAWAMGRMLSQRDLSERGGLKVAAGFPTNIKKREATERRFMSHFVGVTGTNGNTGPLFVFALIGLDRDGGDVRVAPTDSGLTLYRGLLDAGIADGPPFREEAWKLFAAHLKDEAHEELETWLKVLSLVAARPTRDELVAGCTWWQGASAETNSASYVARGREWGLVEPKLDEGRYRLIEFGAAQIKELV